MRAYPHKVMLAGGKVASWDCNGCRGDWASGRGGPEQNSGDRDLHATEQDGDGLVIKVQDEPITACSGGRQHGVNHDRRVRQ